MRTLYLSNRGFARNTNDDHADLRPAEKHETLTPGTREILRRTNWSIPLCRTVASLAGFAEMEG